MKILANENNTENIIRRIKKCLEYEYLTEARQGRVYHTIKEKYNDFNEFEVLVTVRKINE